MFRSQGLHSPWADDAQHTGRYQNPIIATEGEDDSARAHQGRSEHQDSPSPQAIGHQREEETDGYISDQGHGHEQPDPSVGDVQAGQVEGEDEGGGAIGKKTREAGQAEQFCVSR